MEYPCPNAPCTYTNTRRANYLSHLKRCKFQEDRQDNFVCKKCDKKYVTNGALNAHLRKAHPKDKQDSSDE